MKVTQSDLSPLQTPPQTHYPLTHNPQKQFPLTQNHFSSPQINIKAFNNIIKKSKNKSSDEQHKLNHKPSIRSKYLHEHSVPKSTFNVTKHQTQTISQTHLNPQSEINKPN